MKKERLMGVPALLLAAALGACSGSGDEQSEGPLTGSQAGGTCAPADVREWQVNIRYEGDVGAASPDGRRVHVRDVAADLSALVPMELGRNASGANWAPSGHVELTSSESSGGRVHVTAVGSGAPLAGDPARTIDSRILLSIDRFDCTYNLYSSGTITAEITRDGRTESGPASYGTVIIRNQPAAMSISDTQLIPVVEDTFDPQAEMPDVYIPGIGHAPGVSVSWSIEPAEG